MHQKDYRIFISLVKSLGNQLPKFAGKIRPQSTKDTIFNETDIVTKMDVEIEDKITKFVEKLDGKHTVYAEELHSTFHEQENVWVIDPISNTKGFIYGCPHYSITVAHLINGKPVFSLIYDPSVKEMFTAYLGKGSFLNGVKISVNKTLKPQYSFMASLIRPPLDTLEKYYKLHNQLREISSIRNLGSVGVHYCYVACGRADIAITTNKDCFPEFAGKLILEEAGGRMTDFYGNEISIIPKGIIATNSRLHSSVQKMVEESIK